MVPTDFSYSHSIVSESSKWRIIFFASFNFRENSFFFPGRYVDSVRGMCPTEEFDFSLRFSFFRLVVRHRIDVVVKNVRRRRVLETGGKGGGYFPVAV